MNKVTMKDIAEAAQVSLATVSYVLNNNTKQKISEETRQRILGIAQQLQYVPNMAARSLVGNTSSKLVAIVTLKDNDDQPWRKSRYHDLTMRLQELLNERGYDVIVAGTDSSQVELDIILKRTLDALFLIDVPEERFFNISRKFTVPIIVIDSYIEDTMFRKVVPDYRSAIRLAREMLGKSLEPFLVTGKFNNAGMEQALTETFRPDHVYQMDTREGLEQYVLARPGLPGIFANELLAVMAAPYMRAEDMIVLANAGAEYLLPSGVRRIVFDNGVKAQMSIAVMEKLLRKEYDEIEDYSYVPPE
ncbi:LacI family DNA-binding transcriptional regulator [Paenibacillus sp. FSL W8-0186]|uniref:LacI family DNA-binding transcriptional regulator n=1 Tax=Paenibacillus sp. FSL W8-0186 TaxID=2921709 RepID=UPI0030D09960